MVDVFGNPVGISNDAGVVIAADNSMISALLPGGGNNSNFVRMKTGIVINSAGELIGSVWPTGEFADLHHIVAGRVLADGKVISSDGQFLGEVISGDIVIGGDDKVRGIVGIDVKVYKGGVIVGKILTDGLAVDQQNNIIGHVYSIGNAVLSNSGDYIGRVAANGRVIADENNEIGYIKSNGSFVDADKNVSGYVLPEVARNRRN